MKHIRYIVYRDSSEKPQVALWPEDLLHAEYAQKHDIKTIYWLSCGYIGFNKGEWIIYEHSQLDSQNPARKEEDQNRVFAKLKDFKDRDNKTLQAELAETYRQEKHLLLYTIKQDLKKSFETIKALRASARSKQ